jgi:hypothetical protein
MTTRRQALYHGTNDGNSTRDVANYGTKQFDPAQCSSGSQPEEQACAAPGHPDMNAWRNSEAHTVNAEPGVQIFEDPDPQSSPLDPLKDAGVYPKPLLYPLIGVYGGTCGVILGGGPAFGTVVPAGTLPGMNSAGQLVIPTGC